MSKLNETDIQGFVLRGYNLPVARYLGSVFVHDLQFAGADEFNALTRLNHCPFRQ